MSRRHDVRRAKRHLTYTIAEIAETFRITPTTVSHWIREGLQPIDSKRPYLFAGAHLAQFLARKNKPRQPLGPGELYCVACRRTVRPLKDVVDVVPLNETAGQFVGTCPLCRRRPHRHVRLADVTANAGTLTVRYQSASAPLAPISEPAHTSASRDLVR